MIVLIVKVPIAPGKRDEFIQRAQHALIESRKEEGNLSYNLYKSSENDNDLLYVEEWESKEALAKHGKAEHFLAFRKVQEELNFVSGERVVKLYEAQPTTR